MIDKCDNYHILQDIKNKLDSHNIKLIEIGGERKKYLSTGNGTIFTSGEDKYVFGSIENYILLGYKGKEYKHKLFIDDIYTESGIEAIIPELDDIIKNITRFGQYAR